LIGARGKRIGELLLRVSEGSDKPNCHGKHAAEDGEELHGVVGGAESNRRQRSELTDEVLITGMLDEKLRVEDESARLEKCERRGRVVGGESKARSGGVYICAVTHNMDQRGLARAAVHPFARNGVTPPSPKV
jgi:hypothetical protein